MNQQPLRVLVVDDSVIYRKIVSDVLARIPGVEIAGVAANGKIALQKIEQAHPDLVTLDLEMPELDGLGVLRALRERNDPTGAIMLSAFTTQGANATVSALGLGAFDFVIKPSGADPAENAAALERKLREKFEAFRITQCTAQTQAVKSVKPPARLAPPPASTGVSGEVDIRRRMDQIVRGSTAQPEVIAIGISTGGPPALGRLLPRLPADLAAPVLIVQHMPPKFTLSLAQDLASKCPLSVSEAADGDLASAGRIFIAPGGRHMKIARRAEDGALVIHITDDPPENHCRPAVDYLFRSVAHTCGHRAVGVIMTGMGNDGTLGCRLLKRQGAPIIAQDEASCVVFGMPKQPVEEGLAGSVLPLNEIAGEIVRLAGRGVPACK